MTDIDTYQQPAAPALMRRGGSSDLVGWAAEAQSAYTIAQSLATTSFVPKSFVGKPHEITAAILTGRELGLEPMAALRSIHVIQGTPALSANALRGLALARGHQIWVESSSAAKVVVKAQRAGSDHVQTVTWTLQRAEQMGLVQRNPQYRLQPEAMLTARATADAVRLVAADVLLGAPYAVEELDDDGAVEQAAKKTVKRKQLAAVPAPEPEFPEPERPAEDMDPHSAALADWRDAVSQAEADPSEAEEQFYADHGIPVADASPEIIRAAASKLRAA